MADGVFSAQNVPAVSFVTIAYELHPFQVVNIPDWARTTRYDVIAKPAQPTNGHDSLLMLQTLLRERFHLAFHRENRDVDGYALVRVRSDRLGTNIRPSTLDCTVTAPPFPAQCRGGFVRPAGSMKSVGVPISRLVQVLVNRMNGPVSDETRLGGTYDFELQWSNDVGGDGDLRPIDIAIQDQLGLKLERRRVHSELFVVDGFDRPPPD
jgi:uncharacterized protein (TIGR03435 family)